MKINWNIYPLSDRTNLKRRKNFRATGTRNFEIYNLSSTWLPARLARNGDFRKQRFIVADEFYTLSRRITPTETVTHSTGGVALNFVRTTYTPLRVCSLRVDENEFEKRQLIFYALTCKKRSRLQYAAWRFGNVPRDRFQRVSAVYVFAQKRRKRSQSATPTINMSTGRKRLPSVVTRFTPRRAFDTV